MSLWAHFSRWGNFLRVELQYFIHFEIDLGYDNRENHIDRYPGMKEQLRQKGTIIIFPSFIRHRVTPVTKGVRKSLVVWVDGPRFR